MSVSPAEIWLLLDGRRSVGDIAREIAARNGRMPEDVEEEVRGVIERFENLSLISRPSAEGQVE